MDRLQDTAFFEIRIVLDLGGVQRGAGRYSDLADQLHRLLLGVLTVHWLTVSSTATWFWRRIHRRMAFDADQAWMPSAALGPGTWPTCFCRESTGINFSLEDIRAKEYWY
jgi:hypothetical protein